MVRIFLAPTLALALAPLTAAAQDQATLEAFAACIHGDVDMDALDAKMEALFSENQANERLAALCASGDRDGAVALARTVTDALYSREDPDIVAHRACLENHGLMEWTRSAAYLCDQ